MPLLTNLQLLSSTLDILEHKQTSSITNKMKKDWNRMIENLHGNQILPQTWLDFQKQASPPFLQPGYQTKLPPVPKELVTCL